MNTRKTSARLPFWAGLGITLTIGILVAAETAFAAGPPPVGLGTAAPFAVLAGTPAITNTGPTTITGDVGIAPGAAVTGFPPGVVSGTIHAADAVALQAQTDLTGAYTVAAGLPVTATHGTLGGLTLPGGVYSAGGVTLGLTGTLTLDGENDPSSVWVFQASSDLVTASSSTVALINGASPCNVFWQVTSSATLGSDSTFVGTIMALTSITIADSVSVTGRALARNGNVTLINDTISNSCSTASAASATPSPSAASSASATPSASASSSGVPNTAFEGDEPGASWPVFAAIVLTALLLALMVFRTTLAAERRERD